MEKAEKGTISRLLFMIYQRLMSSGSIAEEPQLSLKEKTVLESPSPLRGAFYVGVAGQEMMTYGARSADNGRTW